jgi:hypothetical protein
MQIQNTKDDIAFMRFYVGVEVTTFHNDVLDLVGLSGVTSPIHSETPFEILYNTSWASKPKV